MNELEEKLQKAYKEIELLKKVLEKSKVMIKHSGIIRSTLALSVNEAICNYEDFINKEKTK